MGLRRLIDFINSFFKNPTIDDQEFKQDCWRDVKSRRKYIRSIMDNPEYRGKTKTEIESYFGNNECSHLYQNRWSYFIEITGRKKYVLAFYFEDNLLIDIRYEYKYIV